MLGNHLSILTAFSTDIQCGNKALSRKADLGYEITLFNPCFPANDLMVNCTCIWC